MSRQSVVEDVADPYLTQLEILDAIERSGVDLNMGLKNRGLNYDDLRYEISNMRTWRGPKPLLLDNFKGIPDSACFVSFFTGCGGVDLGLEAAGFRHDAAFEINELFCKTLRRNRPNWHVFGPPIHSGNISKFDEVANSLKKIISIPYEGLFMGGPPCQPFSIAANQRFSKDGDNFKRVGFEHARNGNLLFDFVRLIKEFRPSAFAIENVPGLRDIDGGTQLSAAIEELKAVGYVVEEPMILNASHYGVPQSRTRLFVVGSLTGKPFKAPVKQNKVIGCGSVLLTKNVPINNHETREHHLDSIRRYMTLDYGQRDQLGRVDRLNPMVPSKTVIAGGVNGGGRSHLHPEIPRTLSVRECARLQSFPDNYIFIGPTARQFTQVGNAVPPVLAAQIGKSILESYF